MGSVVACLLLIIGELYTPSPCGGGIIIIYDYIPLYRSSKATTYLRTYRGSSPLNEYGLCMNYQGTIPFEGVIGSHNFEQMQ